MRHYCPRIAKRLLLAVAVLFLLNGCATKIAYHYLDFALIWTLEKYVELDKPQKKKLKEEMEAFHQWHRSTQLPLYSSYMADFKSRYQQAPLTGNQMHAEVDQLQVYLDACIEHLMPSLVDLAASLSDEQVEELLANIAEDRADYRKKYIDVSTEELHAARVKELESNLNLVIRRFNKEQEAAMLDWSQGLVPYEKLTLAQQEIWGKELAEVLAQRDNREILETGLRKLIFVHTDHWDPELEKIVDENQEKSYQFLADLLNGLEGKQRARFIARVERFSEDFHEMSGAD